MQASHSNNKLQLQTFRFYIYPPTNRDATIDYKLAIDTIDTCHELLTENIL